MKPNLKHENARLRQWVADCQSGMYVNCVYCGHRYGPADKVPVAMADALKQHIATCPEHPMSGLIRVAKASFYALGSLLMVRNALTDEFILDLREDIHESLTKAGV